jgi:hypothetical protein
LEIKKLNYGEDHIEYAIILSNLSGAKRSLNKFEEAREGYEKSLKIIEKYYG